MKKRWWPFESSIVELPGYVLEPIEDILRPWRFVAVKNLDIRPEVLTEGRYREVARGVFALYRGVRGPVLVGPATPPTHVLVGFRRAWPRRVELVFAEQS